MKNKFKYFCVTALLGFMFMPTANAKTYLIEFYNSTKSQKFGFVVNYSLNGATKRSSSGMIQVDPGQFLEPVLNIEEMKLSCLNGSGSLLDKKLYVSFSNFKAGEINYNSPISINEIHKTTFEKTGTRTIPCPSTGGGGGSGEPRSSEYMQSRLFKPLGIGSAKAAPKPSACIKDLDSPDLPCTEIDTGTCTPRAELYTYEENDYYYVPKPTGDYRAKRDALFYSSTNLPSSFIVPNNTEAGIYTAELTILPDWYKEVIPSVSLEKNSTLLSGLAKNIKNFFNIKEAQALILETTSRSSYRTLDVAIDDLGTGGPSTPINSTPPATSNPSTNTDTDEACPAGNTNWYCTIDFIPYALSLPFEVLSTNQPPAVQVR